jgi:hypothetical protein
MEKEELENSVELAETAEEKEEMKRRALEFKEKMDRRGTWDE